MARPTDKPRLAAIDPQALGRALTAHMGEWIARLALKLSPAYELRLEGPHGDSDLGLTLQDLAVYAKEGGGLDDVVEEYVLPLCAVLDVPLAPSSGPLPPLLQRWLDGDVDLADLEPDSLPDQIALVITAALGRQQLEREAPLTVAQLAALGSVDPSGLRKLIKGNEIPASGDPLMVSAEAARRWLGTRGVRGL